VKLDGIEQTLQGNGENGIDIGVGGLLGIEENGRASEGPLV
jgi:hypothetical protein